MASHLLLLMSFCCWCLSIYENNNLHDMSESTFHKQNTTIVRRLMIIKVVLQATPSKDGWVWTSEMLAYYASIIVKSFKWLLIYAQNYASMYNLSRPNAFTGNLQ